MHIFSLSLLKNTSRISVEQTGHSVANQIAEHTIIVNQSHHITHNNNEPIALPDNSILS